MAKVAFCGPGRMGAPMAARLVSAGHDVAPPSTSGRWAPGASMKLVANSTLGALMTALGEPSRSPAPSGSTGRRWWRSSSGRPSAWSPRLGVGLRVAEAARSWARQAEEQGLGEMDYSAVVAWSPEARPRCRPGRRS